MAEAPRVDMLLGGRVRLAQPGRGYRVAIDPVLLAAAVPATDGQRVLDVGCGTGGVTLCLAARVSGAAIVALEREPAFALLARANVADNGFEDRVQVVEGDLLAPPAAIGAGFDHVVMNPPYLEPARASRSPDPLRDAANVEGAARLDDWIGFAFGRIRRGGRITLVHRADRLPHVLEAIRARQRGGIVVKPVVPRAGDGARRVLVAVIAGSAAPFRLAGELALHDTEGNWTAAANTVLRDAASLDL